MVDISSKFLRMVIDFPYYLKYDKSQDLKVYYFYPPVQIEAFGGALSGSAAAQVGDKCDYEKAGLPVD